MTGRYTGDCCPVCGTYQDTPYALVLGAREEFGYHCDDCHVTWRVLAYNAAAGAEERNPAA